MTGHREFCRGCGARIVWAVTIDGRKVPVDFLPVHPGGHGTVVLIDRSGRSPFAGMVAKGDGQYTDHRLTCRYRDHPRPSASKEAVERRAA